MRKEQQQLTFRKNWLATPQTLQNPTPEDYIEVLVVLRASCQYVRLRRFSVCMWWLDIDFKGHVAKLLLYFANHWTRAMISESLKFLVGYFSYLKRWVFGIWTCVTFESFGDWIFLWLKFVISESLSLWAPNMLDFCCVLVFE